MDKQVEGEILFHILNTLSDRVVDGRQLLNMVKPDGDGYILRVYGETLRFNSDGDLI